MKKPTLAQLERHRRLLPNNYPRYVRVYDKGPGVEDQFTVVYIGRYNFRGGRAGQKDTNYWYLLMNGEPLSPNGYCQLESTQHWAVDLQRDRGGFQAVGIGRVCSLGKRIQWHDLPEACKTAALHVYKELWDLYPAEAKDGKIRVQGFEEIRSRRAA